MYYPYLRARQFELIALRELARAEQVGNHILPIIEPVKKSHNNLKLAINDFNSFQQYAHLIVNPSVGELAGDTDQYLSFLREREEQNIIPAFHYRDNANYINKSIATYDLKDCMLICHNDVSIE